MRLLGMGLVAATIGTFTLSALATAGIIPVELWGPVSIAAAVALVVLLVVSIPLGEIRQPSPVPMAS
jgi:hypothetical protein